MDECVAAEEGFKRGYEKGYADGKKHAEDEIIILKQKRANIFEILDAYERGRVNALKWIPVSERLPEKDGKYLVFKQHHYGAWQDVVGFAKDGESVNKYDLENEKDVWYNYDSEYGYYSIDSVTHWMPLPEPPKEA